MAQVEENINQEYTMGMLKGQNEYKKFSEGKKLTRKQSMLAQCYQCNGREASNTDCGGQKTCPMYEYSPYKGA